MYVLGAKGLFQVQTLAPLSLFLLLLLLFFLPFPFFKKVSHKVAQVGIRLVPPHLVTFDFSQGTFGDGSCLRGGHFSPPREAVLRALSECTVMGGYVQETVSKAILQNIRSPSPGICHVSGGGFWRQRLPAHAYQDLE